jgi:hypothetical protein
MEAREKSERKVMTEEERKERKKQRNAAYYEKNKQRWREIYDAKVTVQTPQQIMQYVDKLSTEERLFLASLVAPTST